LQQTPILLVLQPAINLEFFSIQMDSYEFTRNSQTQSWLDAESIPSLILSTNRVIRPMLAGIMADVFAACEGSDAVIYHSYALPFVHYFCQQLNIPSIPASLHPMPTRSYPAILSNMTRSPSKSIEFINTLACSSNFLAGIFASCSKALERKNSSPVHWAL
jgi:hypothetical protein